MYDEQLSSILSDILNGYSEVKVSGETVFAKHLDFKTELHSASLYQSYFNKYKKNGLPTQGERLAFLIEEGEWSKEDEIFIEKNTLFLESLRSTKSKLILESQREEIERNITDTTQKIQEKTLLKNMLIGATCERYASQKKEEQQIIGLMFQDTSLETPFVSDEDFEYMDHTSLKEIFDAYFSLFNAFSEENFKKISVMPIFYNFFSLSPKDDPAHMLRKPLMDLTFFQQKLLHHAQRVRSIYENVPDIPDEIKDNYDALVEFSERDTSGIKGARGNAGYSMVGAREKDMKRAGIDTAGTKSPFKMLKESGKTSLNKKDFISMVES